jgi:glycosyltransferase involved in cell wall biosynthesis
MHILFVTDFYKPHVGGVEKLFSSLAETLVADGNEATFITWKFNKQLPAKETINGVTIYRIAAPARLLFSLIALPQIIKQGRHSQIIHTSTYSAAIGAWFAGKLLGKKVIITVHEVWANLWLKMPFLSKPSRWVFKGFEKWLLKLSFDHYVAVSDFTRKTLENTGIATKKISRIYNGILYDLPQWKNPELPFTFCFFGRAGASKGLDILIEAAKEMQHKHPQIKFKFIVSPQIPRIFKKVKQEICNGELSTSSIFLSQLPHEQLINEILSSHCVIIPSLCEGFGFTAVEACSMKIPLISSGQGSLPEVVSGNIITMDEYSPQGLTDAMQKAINGSFEHIEDKKFTVETFVENHKQLYYNILQNNK